MKWEIKKEVYGLRYFRKKDYIYRGKDMWNIFMYFRNFKLFDIIEGCYVKR